MWHPVSSLVEMKFGNHGRAVVYNWQAKYDKILHAEMSGEFIERLPGAQEEKGESLVMGTCYL